MDGLEASSYGEAFADIYDEWYANISDLEGTLDTVTSLAGGGPILELGIGTGRLALPLAARGLDVHGIDASPAMVARLRSKPGGQAIPVTIGDFADLDLESATRYRLVLAAYNTLFNLTTAEAQRRCLASVARRLHPDGCLVVEAFVPSPDPEGVEGQVSPSVVATDRVVLQVTKRYPDTQTVDGSTISITEAGIRLRPWRIRYASPGELDDMAAAAGLTLAGRYGGWREEPFRPDGSTHVSIYRLATGTDRP